MGCGGELGWGCRCQGSGQGERSLKATGTQRKQGRGECSHSPDQEPASMHQRASPWPQAFPCRSCCAVQHGVAPPRTLMYGPGSPLYALKQRQVSSTITAWRGGPRGEHIAAGDREGTAQRGAGWSRDSRGRQRTERGAGRGRGQYSKGRRSPQGSRYPSAPAHLRASNQRWPALSLQVAAPCQQPQLTEVQCRHRSGGAGQICRPAPQASAAPAPPTALAASRHFSMAMSSGSPCTQQAEQKPNSAY